MLASILAMEILSTHILHIVTAKWLKEHECLFSQIFGGLQGRTLGLWLLMKIWQLAKN